MWRSSPSDTEAEANVEGKPNPQYDQNLYSKVDESVIKGRLEEPQKELTPSRAIIGVEGFSEHDTHLTLYTGGRTFEILARSLQRACEYDYRTDPRLKSTSGRVVEGEPS